MQDPVVPAQFMSIRLDAKHWSSEPPPWPINSLTIDLAKMCDLVDFRRVSVRPAGSSHACKINAYTTGCQGFVFPNLQYIILIPKA